MAEWDFTQINQLLREKSYKEKRDVSQRMLAEAVGLALPTVERYASGRVVRPDLTTVYKIARYFGVPILFFRVGEDEEEEVPGNQLSHPISQVAQFTA